MAKITATPEYLKINASKISLTGKVELVTGKYSKYDILGHRKDLAYDAAIKRGLLKKSDVYDIREVNNEFIVTSCDPYLKTSVGKIPISKLKIIPYSKFLKILANQKDEPKNKNLADFVNNQKIEGIKASLHDVGFDGHFLGDDVVDGVEISYTDNHELVILN